MSATSFAVGLLPADTPATLIDGLKTAIGGDIGVIITVMVGVIGIGVVVGMLNGAKKGKLKVKA